MKAKMKQIFEIGSVVVEIRLRRTRTAITAVLLALAILFALEIPEVSATTCPPLTQGYWKNHPSAWKVSSLTLGTKTYTKTQLLSILGMSSKSDASLILADQLIAALLNIANGTDGSAVSATISDANTSPRDGNDS